MSKKFAVLGSPISHSKSPAIHQAAYRVLGEDWEYERFDVPKGSLRKFIESEGSGFSGFSLTMPLKENAYSFAAVNDELSQLTKATNTLANFEGKWFGFNTDIYGIMQAVSNKAPAEIRKVLIIGSGATATSALVAVSKLAPEAQVLVFARNKVSRKAVLDFARGLGQNAKRAFSLVGAMASADLVISTLPGGALNPVADRLVARTSFKPRGLLLDVAYDPWPSRMAEIWTSRGAPVTSGKEMLLWQAVAQIRIFKNQSPVEPLMNEVAVIEAMRIAIGE